MWILYIICGIVILVLYIWKKTIRHIINTLIIWALQIITWGLQGAGWITGIIMFVFQVIDGREDIEEIGGLINKPQKSQTPAKFTSEPKIDLNNKEQLAEFLKTSKNYRIEPIVK